MIDLFYEYKDSNVASYADDTTPYSCAIDIPSVALELQASASKLFRWLKNNHVKANPLKSHVLLGTKKPQNISIDEISFAAIFHKKLIGITIDLDLKFENHITELCLKVNKKLNTLCCISSSISLEKHRTLTKAFTESQFNYCLLIRMLHSRIIK